jgi:hypothetical protein
LSTVNQFNQLLNSHGSAVVYHRENSSTVDCPCLTPEGFRDPEWHLAHPTEPVCNAEGKIPIITQYGIKGFVQPAQSTRATRLSDEYMQQLFGQVQADDHIGIFPIEWDGNTLDFSDWSQHGDEWVQYDSKKFFIVNSNKLPDPSDGNPNHHYEVGLRIIRG